jgi:hypothetical protein
MWNHFETVGPKTNNHVEAYNLVLKKIVNYEKSPNIYDSCEIFQFQEEKSHKSYLEAKRGKPAPPRRKNDIAREVSLFNYKKMLDRHSILLEAYFEAVAELYVTKTHDSKFSDLVEVEYYHDSGFDEKCLC